MSFYIEIMTPEKQFFTGEIETLIINTPNGEMGVLKNHIPLVVTVSIGPLKMKHNGEWVIAFLNEGFMELKDNKAIILVDTAEWPNEIDKNRATEAKQRAEERLQRQLNNQEYIRTKAAITRATQRLKITKKKNF